MSRLEPTREEFLKRLAATGERIADHIETLPLQDAADLDSEAGLELARSLRESAPESPLDPVTGYDDILELLFGRLAERSFNAPGPGYLAYIPGGGLPDAAIADLIADTVNRYTGVFTAAPGLAQLELNVLRWLCDFVGLPAEAGGILTSGGSTATLSALVTARHERLGDDFGNAVIYTSDQAHHCIAKSARIAGFRNDQVRVIPADAHFRLAPTDLAAAIEDDRATGRRPFLVAAAAGTTNTGAVDPLSAIADLAEREGLWLHVDGAYGGFFVLTARGRDRLRGIERADSVVLDPHKGMFLPYGTGALLVRDGPALRRAHGQGAAYLPQLQDGDDFPDFCETSPELSRPYRGLRVWLPLKLHGVSTFRQQLDEKIDLTEWITTELESLPGIEMVAPPELSLCAFRVRKEGASEEERNALTAAFLDGVNHRQRVHITGTRLRGQTLARICVLSFRTHRERMEMALEDIKKTLEEIL